MSSLSSIRSVSIPASSPPAVRAAAGVLLDALGASVTERADGPGDGLNLCLAAGPWSIAEAPAGAEAWMWARVTPEGAGELVASSPSFLYALAHLVADGALPGLADGVSVPVSFPFHRPLFDTVLTQVARTQRGFDAETYIRGLARAGFSHLEVNGLACQVPLEPGVPTEYYNQFYSYCPGFNHFVDSTYSRGIWPSEYLEANRRRMQHVAEIGRDYGLTPGLLSFEPRSFPETFFQRYPTLRGARIDHPFRSHLPRYTLAQDHPAARDHYRQVMAAMMEAVPDLAYLSVWSNDSGAGFEHTSSLYVGRNGGPYLIREWREPEQIAEAAGQSALRWLRLMQETAAETNPDFEVSLRLEPFKTEHDVLLAGMGEGLTVEAPSLLVRGYELPYAHPRYPEQTSAAGSLFHTDLVDEEADLVAAHRAAGFEPKLTYSVGSSFNTEPLLGIPFPTMLHRKLSAMRAAGVRAASAFGGLLDLGKTPYWPNTEVIRAAQFTPDVPVEDVLLGAATRWAGDHAEALVGAWEAVEDAVSHLPIVPLYSFFGFVWLRTWVRPLVPDMEAVPLVDRAYYERFLVSTANNPAINDLGRDVLFDLITEDSGRRMAGQIDDNVLPRVDHALGLIDAAMTGGADRAVFQDLRDRTEALRCWAVTQRNTCAWVGDVYGFLEAETDDARDGFRAGVQRTVDLDLENTRRLLDLWETAEAEFMLVSGAGETSFVYGENFGDLLRRKLDLTEAYRDRDPAIDRDILWRLP